MPVAVLILVLVAYVLVLILYPEVRRWAVAGGVVAALGLAFYFSREAPEATRAGSRIAPEEVTLDQIDVEQTIRGATLTGRIENGSERYRLRDLTLALRLRDCPAEDTPLESCPVIGEASAIARPDVPAGQIRALSAHFIFTSLPPVAGTLRWDWRIEEIRATNS